VSWVDAHRERANALVGAACAFAPDGFPSGGEGVRWLARAIAAFRAEPAADDRAFVEGAGACFALLLLDQIGEGAFDQTLRVGVYGSIDPFGAIEAVLDAADSWAELATRIREAEREARGDGSRSRVFAAFAEELERSRPGLAIARIGHDSGWLDGNVEVDLRRVVSATADLDRDAVAAQVRRIVELVPRSDAIGDAPPLALEEIVPRLVARSFIDGFEEQNTRLAHRALTSGVLVAFVLVLRDRARYLRADELARQPEIPAHAIRNLAARSGTARFDRLETPDGPLVVGCTGDGHDAARLLLPALHEVLAVEVGTPFLVAVPHRDCLLAAPRDAGAEQALAARVRAAHARAPHAISTEIFELGPAGLKDRSEDPVDLSW
jgi:uncharacterized protein YtpQ (UPF0354 family)